VDRAENQQPGGTSRSPAAGIPVDVALDAVPLPIVLIDGLGVVASVNATARQSFALFGQDVGRPFEDLDISSNPVDLRSAVEQVRKEQRPLVLEGVAWPSSRRPVDCLDVHVVPLAGAGTDDVTVAVAVAVVFVDVSLSRRLQEELEVTKRNLEAAYDELRLSNERLERANDQLPSTIAEMETTNEELQSTNEELGATNAELQSVSEELQAISDELRARTTELERVNEFLESMLVSQRGGLIVVDRDLRISVWNDSSAELWGLRTDEAPGQHFLNIDIGLPVEELRDPIRSLLAGESDHATVMLEATNRRGREFRCHVTMTPLLNRAGQTRGVILITEDAASRS
jgi:two-component system, chemotaxis family, CheB/CheR fusion protein